MSKVISTNIKNCYKCGTPSRHTQTITDKSEEFMSITNIYYCSNCKKNFEGQLSDLRRV